MIDFTWLSPAIVYAGQKLMSGEGSTTTQSNPSNGKQVTMSHEYGKSQGYNMRGVEGEQFTTDINRYANMTPTERYDYDTRQIDERRAQRQAAGQAQPAQQVELSPEANYWAGNTQPYSMYREALTAAAKNDAARSGGNFSGEFSGMNAREVLSHAANKYGVRVSNEERRNALGGVKDWNDPRAIAFANEIISRVNAGNAASQAQPAAKDSTEVTSPVTQAGKPASTPAATPAAAKPAAQPTVTPSASKEAAPAAQPAQAKPATDKSAFNKWFGEQVRKGNIGTVQDYNGRKVRITYGSEEADNKARARWGNSQHVDSEAYKLKLEREGAMRQPVQRVGTSLITNGVTAARPDLNVNLERISDGSIPKARSRNSYR